jgi:hypothetical protein
VSKHFNVEHLIEGDNKKKISCIDCNNEPILLPSEVSFSMQLLKNKESFFN